MTAKKPNVLIYKLANTMHTKRFLVVNLIDEITGQQIKAPRIVIIDDNGVGYTCVSIGIFSALKKIFQIFGVPTYSKPLTVIPTQITRGANKILTLNLK